MSRLTNHVLLIGWEGADWHLIQPLLDDGKLPNLAKLIEQGVSGPLRSLRPQVPPMQWTSIATGKTGDRHGIVGYLKPSSSTHSVVPFSSLDRNCKAIWNILTQSDMESIIVGWKMTHPVEPIRGTMVSELFPGFPDPDIPDYLLPGSVYPESLGADLGAVRVRPADLSLDNLVPFVPGITLELAQEDSRLHYLASVISECASVHKAATWLALQKPWDFMAIGFDLINRISQAFMVFHPPRLSGIDESLFQLYGEAVNNAYQYCDILLGRLLSTTGDDVTTILVSDHGFTSGPGRPMITDRLYDSRCYRDQGIFIASGDGVSKNEKVFSASLADITPTILKLLGLPVGRDMDGKPLAEVFENPADTGETPSWEGRISPCGQHPEKASLDNLSVQQSLERFTRLGVLEELGFNSDSDISAEEVTMLNRHVLAMIYMESSRPKLALPLLQQCVERFPENASFGLHLANCHVRIGQKKAARKVLESIETDVPRASVEMMLANLDLADGNHDQALARLFRAEQVLRNDPSLHCQIGEVYLKAQRWDEAGQAFDKALRLDADYALAHYGKSIVSLGLENYEQAVDHALEALQSDLDLAKAHYSLGVGLSHIDQAPDAINAFENCLARSPDLINAHKWLNRLYSSVEGMEDRARQHLDAYNQNKALGYAQHALNEELSRPR